MIVADTTREDTNRFALVIFNAPEFENELYDVLWLFREIDLSKAFMSKSRVGMHVDIYNDDGSQESCIVKWDETRQEYSCGTWRRITH